MAEYRLYKYRALPDNQKYFRLLELLPGTDEEPLRCRLRTESLRDAPAYEAISYVWRVFHDDRDFTTVQLDGGDEHLAITWNLKSAFKRIRHHKRVRILWCDAVCINQSDLRERQDQVPRMGKIYAGASRVLAWLGDVNFDSADIFDFLRDVAAVSPAPNNYGSDACDFKKLDAFLAEADHRYWIMLRLLHQADLFSRVWIVQEINLALDGFLITSQCSIQLVHFKTAVFWISKRRTTEIEKFQISWKFLDPYLYLHFICNDPSRLNITNSRNRQPAHYVLRSIRNCDCTLPHDKIYAILGHCSLLSWLEDTTDGVRVPINYEIPYAELYLLVAQRLLREKQPLLTLSLVDHDEKQWAEIEAWGQMPSWVPNWNSPARTYFLPNEYRVRYNASTGEDSWFEFHGRTLHIRGCVVDRVAWRSETMDSSNLRAGLAECSGPSLGNVIGSIWTQLQRNKEARVEDTVESFLRDFCLTLNAGNRKWWKQTYITDVTTDQRMADCVAALAQLGAITQGHCDGTYGVRGEIGRFLATTEDICINRCFFITESGLMGLGPRVTAVGDDVCLLFGAQVPFVLRPLQAQQQYRLCGESYVNGIMDGEALSRVYRGELTESILELV